jgi:hypothetical protein
MKTTPDDKSTNQAKPAPVIRMGREVVSKPAAGSNPAKEAKDKKEKINEDQASSLV